MIWWAFERGGCDVLSAIVMPENKPSLQVIEKLGFAYGGTRTFDDGTVFDYFRLYNTDTLPGPVWDRRSLYKPEKMGDFFNVRADGYNEHMLGIGMSGAGCADYITYGGCFPKTGEAIKILNIGCGTGLELDYIWAQAPNAHIVCVDMSRAMLDLLLKNHPGGHSRLTVIEASFVDWAYPAETYDIVTSHACMHHFWPEEKIAIYRKILASLKRGGHYIEGDFIVDHIHAEQYRKRYEIITANLPEKAKPGEYHIDIPFTLDVQLQLQRSAGFSRVEVLDEDVKPNASGAITRAWK
jgi:tRNA (cmo5U34)-methyltransferase